MTTLASQMFAVLAVLVFPITAVPLQLLEEGQSECNRLMSITPMPRVLSSVTEQKVLDQVCECVEFNSNGTGDAKTHARFWGNKVFQGCYYNEEKGTCSMAVEDHKKQIAAHQRTAYCHKEDNQLDCCKCRLKATESVCYTRAKQEKTTALTCQRFCGFHTFAENGLDKCENFINQKVPECKERELCSGVYEGQSLNFNGRKFPGCNCTQMFDILTIARISVGAVANVLFFESCSKMTLQEQLHFRWSFGTSCDQNKLDLVRHKYQMIFDSSQLKDRLTVYCCDESKHSYQCSTCKSEKQDKKTSTIAYTTIETDELGQAITGRFRDSNSVKVCPHFWAEPSDQGHTFVHELSHAIAATEDYAYGRLNVLVCGSDNEVVRSYCKPNERQVDVFMPKQIEQFNQESLLNNADSYAFFAMSDPNIDSVEYSSSCSEKFVADLQMISFLFAKERDNNPQLSLRGTPGVLLEYLYDLDKLSSIKRKVTCVTKESCDGFDSPSTISWDKNRRIYQFSVCFPTDFEAFDVCDDENSKMYFHGRTVTTRTSSNLVTYLKIEEVCNQIQLSTCVQKQCLAHPQILAAQERLETESNKIRLTLYNRKLSTIVIDSSCLDEERVLSFWNMFLTTSRQRIADGYKKEILMLIWNVFTEAKKTVQRGNGAATTSTPTPATAYPLAVKCSLHSTDADNAKSLEFQVVPKDSEIGLEMLIPSLPDAVQMKTCRTKTNKLYILYGLKVYVEVDKKKKYFYCSEPLENEICLQTVHNKKVAFKSVSDLCDEWNRLFTPEQKKFEAALFAVAKGWKDTPTLKFADSELSIATKVGCRFTNCRPIFQLGYSDGLGQCELKWTAANRRIKTATFDTWKIANDDAIGPAIFSFTFTKTNDWNQLSVENIDVAKWKELLRRGCRQS